MTVHMISQGSGTRVLVFSYHFTTGLVLHYLLVYSFHFKTSSYSGLSVVFYIDVVA